MIEKKPGPAGLRRYWYHLAMMKRTIWRQPSAALLKRLASARCTEYRRLKAELLRLDDIWGPHVIAFGCYEELTRDAEFNRVAAELCRLYQDLKPKERAAVDEINGLELANNLIAEKIDAIWHAKRLPNTVADVASEQTFIEVLRVKYLYPDYAELVGPAAESDFTDVARRNGTVRRQLTLDRKADLLLLGVFEWKGMYITQALAWDPDVSTGWLVFTEPEYRPDDWLGAYYRDYSRGLSKTPSHRSDAVTFRPYLNHEAAWLHDYLFDCDSELGYRAPRTKFQRVRFQDNNPYNCLPDNLALIEKRGRRMLCKGCGIKTTPEESMVISGKDRKLRLCLQCLRGLHEIEL